MRRDPALGAINLFMINLGKKWKHSWKRTLSENGLYTRMTWQR